MKEFLMITYLQAYISVELETRNMICVPLQIISIYCKPKKSSTEKINHPLHSK